MKKLLFVLTVFSFLAFSCGNEADKETESDATEETVEALNVETIVEKAGENVDKEVVIEGTVAHVCKHGGKKMFLMGENPDVRIKITPNEEISAFETDLEGSDVIVTGKVVELRVDEEYLTNWEEEIKLELEKDAEVEDKEHKIEEGNPAHLGKHEDKEEHADDPFAGVNDLRKELEESGKDHLSFYSVECSSFELK